MIRDEDVGRHLQSRREDEDGAYWRARNGDNTCFDMIFLGPIDDYG